MVLADPELREEVRVGLRKFLVEGVVVSLQLTVWYGKSPSYIRLYKATRGSSRASGPSISPAPTKPVTVVLAVG